MPEFRNFEVFIDSPLAVEATNIFHKNDMDCFNDEAKSMVEAGVNPIRFDGLRVAVSSDESRQINFDPKPKVIISASGMCEAGRIRHHLKHNLWRSNSTILFVGFQCEGTLGHSLINGADKAKLFGEEIEVKAWIVNLPGISGHADMDHLTTWIDHFKNGRPPRKVFVVHGEESCAESFTKHIIDDIGMDAVAPYSGDTYDLITGECIAEGDRKKVEKRQLYKASATVFDRLVLTGERLVAVIKKCRGMANKDLAKFADQINALCDKWER